MRPRHFGDFTPGVVDTVRTPEMDERIDAG